MLAESPVLTHNRWSRYDEGGVYETKDLRHAVCFRWVWENFDVSRETPPEKVTFRISSKPSRDSVPVVLTNTNFGKGKPDYQWSIEGKRNWKDMGLYQSACRWLARRVAKKEQVRFHVTLNY